MSAHELRLQAAVRITKKLLGDDFRSDRPLETLGGYIGNLIERTASYEDYQHRIGRIRGLKEALAELDDAFKDLTDPPEEKK